MVMSDYEEYIIRMIVDELFGLPQMHKYGAKIGDLISYNPDCHGLKVENLEDKFYRDTVMFDFLHHYPVPAYSTLAWNDSYKSFRLNHDKWKSTLI